MNFIRPAAWPSIRKPAAARGWAGHCRLRQEALLSLTHPSPRPANRLIHESSPYLLQHAHNPVDWYAWGPEAFERARREDKPIFLSVGYSTCYWCHVMERQSFEVEAVAAEMNRLFVNIKVDREERPDVDQLYMTAVQVQTRQGGWPMSVFLTPDLKYFYGGTYFPPADAYGRPGFVTLLRAIDDAYRNRRQDVLDTAEQFVEILQRAAEPPPAREPTTIDLKWIERLVERSTSDYDPRDGGFGGAPKFPRETLLELILAFLDDQAGARSAGAAALAPANARIARQLYHTLDAMADGGIRDQLGGGFHRYSTDARWLVPHFEIMLYDNAMLGWVYAEAHRQSGQQRYASVARGIFDFVLREMTAPDGAFYTAFDAEVDAQEGLSYLWTADEIESVLGADDARLFNRVYGVDRGPNFADPHHGTGRPDKNILFLPVPLPEAARALGMEESAMEARLAPLRQKLYDVRLGRKQPLLDTKVITSWNSLMIRALAHGGTVLAEPRYTAAAERAARFLLDHHRRSDGGLHRASRDGKVKYDGFLDDYSFFIQSLLSLHAATGDPTWATEAARLADDMKARFGDERAGGFFFTDRDARDLIVRQKTATDSPLPSGNAVAAMVLAELTDPEAARRTIALFAGQVSDYGEGMSSMLLAALTYVRQYGAFTVSPKEDAPTRQFPTPREVAADVVSVTADWPDPRTLVLTLAIMDGFHINAKDVATADAPLIPTSVSILDNSARETIEYPPARQHRFPFAPEHPIAIYSGTVQIHVRFDADQTPGIPVRVTITYQACSEDACLPPVTRQIEVANAGTAPR
jgi:hypothetical protein